MDQIKHSDTERFITLSMLFDERLPEAFEGDEAIFEAYAFAAKGRLAQIGENTGTMKAVLRGKGYNIRTVAPNQAKATATGKGNADKLEMADGWYKRFGFHVHEYLACGKGESPASDVIDSFFMLETWKRLQKEAQS
jgi:Holliday junction resolvasome RuvABC endonuclease subunit